MLKTFKIANYKSIEQMTLVLGRVNVLIGENGAGKSNILEAIALAGAAQAGKLDNEFLASRGIRAVNAKLMRSAFDEEAIPEISLSSLGSNGVLEEHTLKNDGAPYSQWTASSNRRNFNDFLTREHIGRALETTFQKAPSEEHLKTLQQVRDLFASLVEKAEKNEAKNVSIKLNASSELANFFEAAFPPPDDHLSDFVVYSPENSHLRVFEHESQIAPLGIRGEGLLKLLTVLEQSVDRKPIEQIKRALCMLGWFSNYTITQENSPRMEITDRYLAEGNVFDQRSANEGFLYIAFYLALFCSNLTPKLFAIDNIDASLNPKLCRAMIEQLTTLAVQNDKQVILTTHNPAVLDGLDLNDDEQRLFVIERDENGRTQAFRRRKPKYEGKPRKLSELFMAGALGGLPTDF